MQNVLFIVYNEFTFVAIILLLSWLALTILDLVCSGLLALTGLKFGIGNRSKKRGMFASGKCQCAILRPETSAFLCRDWSILIQ